MGRLFAVFNVIAGGASIIGLYLTAFTDYNSWILAVLFVATAVFVGYVLFVPGNRIEENVSAKLQKYQSSDGIGTVTMLRDEFVVAGYSWKEIPFPHPFKEPPPSGARKAVRVYLYCPLGGRGYGTQICSHFASQDELHIRRTVPMDCHGNAAFKGRRQKGGLIYH